MSSVPEEDKNTRKETPGREDEEVKKTVKEFESPEVCTHNNSVV